MPAAVALHPLLLVRHRARPGSRASASLARSIHRHAAFGDLRPPRREGVARPGSTLAVRPKAGGGGACRSTRRPPAPSSHGLFSNPAARTAPQAHRSRRPSASGGGGKGSDLGKPGQAWASLGRAGIRSGGPARLAPAEDEDGGGRRWQWGSISRPRLPRRDASGGAALGTPPGDRLFDVESLKDGRPLTQTAVPGGGGEDGETRWEGRKGTGAVGKGADRAETDMKVDWMEARTGSTGGRGHSRTFCLHTGAVKLILFRRLARCMG